MATLVVLRITSLLVLLCALALTAAAGYTAVRCRRQRTNVGPAVGLVAATSLLAAGAVVRVVWAWGVGTFWAGAGTAEFLRPMMIQHWMTAGATLGLALALLGFRVRRPRTDEDPHA